MGLALGGSLEEAHKLTAFSVRESGLVLRQMLKALIYLHDDFNITHRDIKPANILCDSRAHLRLADFGIAKEGNILQTFKGTHPWMAPEMFKNMPYTSAVDLWALGKVIAWLLSPSRPAGLKGDEGYKWCAAVVAQFQRYEECFQAMGSNVPERIALNNLVGQHMLKMNPKDRKSAVGCLVQGGPLWSILDQESDQGSKTPTQQGPTEGFPNTPSAKTTNRLLQDSEHVEDGGAIEDNYASEEEIDSYEENAVDEEDVVPSGQDESLGSEGETAIAKRATLNSDDWESLEQRFPVDEANGHGNEGRIRSPKHFIYALSTSQPERVPGDSTPPGYKGNSRPNSARHSAIIDVRKRTSQRSRSETSAAPQGVQKPVHRRNISSLSKSAAAAAARHTTEDDSQNSSAHTLMH